MSSNVALEDLEKIVALAKKLRKSTSTPNKGSRNDWLFTFQIGERRYIETEKNNYAHLMRMYNAPNSRLPSAMKEMKFSTSVLTAVGSTVGDVRYLLCIERLK